LEASLTAQDLVRPWRRATLVASLIAGVELVLLLVCGALLVAKPLTNALRTHAKKVATTQQRAAVAPAPVHQTVKTAKHHRVAPAPVLHPRAETDVLVLNGNGENGAAHAEASKLQSIGYRVSGAENAKRHDYATTFVMYLPGYKPEAQRLARDLHLHVVGPLDGLKPSALKGGKLAVVLGAS
jgi:hypothetical protein